MKSRQSYCLREFGYLYRGSIDNQTNRHIGIPESSFDHLFSCIQSEDDTDNIQSFLRLKNHRNKLAIQVQNYVGVLQTPCGTQIEILPKIYNGYENESSNGGDDDLKATRNVLLRMLRCLTDSPFKSTGHAQIHDTDMPLLEIYISQFLGLVNQLVKRGIRSDYIAIQKNANFLKGRLLLSQQLRKNTFHQERFYIEYQEYQVNRPANRLIKTALLGIIKKSRNARNQRLSRELGFVFEEVPTSQNIDLDFKMVKTDRSMGYYKDVLVWCKLLLKGHGPTTSSGNFTTLSLLYPIERLFEDYVTHHLRKSLNKYFPNATSLKAQSKKHYLVEKHDGKRMFNLQPDLIAMNGNSPINVMDTKWKLLDSQDRVKKYGISQTDMYQLYAYGHKYLEGVNSKELFLIYPATNTFYQPLPEFVYEHGFRLRVVPFDLDKGKLII